MTGGAEAEPGGGMTGGAEPERGGWLAPAGAALAGLAVLAGAFGAHALRSRLSPDLLATFETAVRYQMYHALALLALGLGARRRHSAFTAAGLLFLLGTVLFSGSLYALALTGRTAFGVVTPFGGVAFLAGWASLAVGASRALRTRR